MPDYDFTKTDSVAVKIAGRIWDENYTRLLMSNTTLDLKTVILLDRVQKSQSLKKDELKHLRKQGLVEGNKPNVHVAASVAKVTNQQGDYIRNKGFDNKYYRDLVLEYITKFDKASRANIQNLLEEKLPAALTDKQKKDKVKNTLQYLKANGSIGTNTNNKWVLKK